MPKLGDVFINTVYAENPSNGVKITEHPIEDGANVADHVERQNKTMDISGVITGPDASMRRTKLEQYMKSGKMLKYSYRNVLTNVLIKDFDTTHDVDTLGGYKYKMSLVQVRVAQTAKLAKPIQTKKVTSGGQKQANTNKAASQVYVVKKGDSLWKIAEKKLGNALRWPEIYRKNKKTIGSNPNLIYPGQRYILP